eukprot:TRINITY_DN8584_c0_g1_i1.p1 TRINITY_DN8584_c0_g1~~TRINITY_DN8584_c0_g1_i1.p1  ORF type:complete len:131 (+),score=29.61 TRINITY_DN8584_c0_g1_i1:175-567(+)
MLNTLLKKGIKARVALGDLSAVTSKGKHALSAGSIILPTGLQTVDNFTEILAQAQTEFNIPIIGIQSGLTPSGVDLGSRKLAPVTLPKVLLIGGKGTSQYEVGETWYYLDQHVGIAPTVIDIDRLTRIDF